MKHADRQKSRERKAKHSRRNLPQRRHTTFLAMAQDVLSMLYTELVNEEDTIDRLLPTKEYLWETNSTLRERLKKATDTLANPSNYKINQIMENLPKSLAYVDETVQTLCGVLGTQRIPAQLPHSRSSHEEQLKTKKSSHAKRPAVPTKVRRRIPKTLLQPTVQRILLRQRQHATNQKRLSRNPKTAPSLRGINNFYIPICLILRLAKF